MGFFNSQRGSCITDKENSRLYTKKQMSAIFGNSDAVWQSNYVHAMPEEVYAALGGLSVLAVVSAGHVKKSPLDSPFSGGISGFFAYINELTDRRVTFYDLCKMLCEEWGVDVELFNKVVAANPVVGKIPSFVNSLLIEAYDDTPRRITLNSFVWRCGYVVSKSLLLFRAFYKNFTMPQEVLEKDTGGQGIRTLNRSPGN